MLFKSFANAFLSFSATYFRRYSYQEDFDYDKLTENSKIEALLAGRSDFDYCYTTLDIDDDFNYTFTVPERYANRENAVSLNFFDFGNIVDYNGYRECDGSIVLEDKDISDYDIDISSFETGYSLSGIIEIPEDAVLSEYDFEFDIYDGKSENALGTYHTAVIATDYRTPFSIVVPKDVGSVYLQAGGLGGQ